MPALVKRQGRRWKWPKSAFDNTMVAAELLWASLESRRVLQRWPYRAHIPALALDPFAQAVWELVAGVGHASYPEVAGFGTASLSASSFEPVCGAWHCYAGSGAAHTHGFVE